MKLGELRKKVKESGGKIVESKLRFEYKEDGEDLDVYGADTTGIIAYFPKACEDGLSLEGCVSIIGGIANINSFIDLAEWLHIRVRDIESVTKTVTVKETSTEELMLKGKVEAYENILIGRAITASK